LVKLDGRRSPPVSNAGAVAPLRHNSCQETQSYADFLVGPHVPG